MGQNTNFFEKPIFYYIFRKVHISARLPESFIVKFLILAQLEPNATFSAFKGIPKVFSYSIFKLIILHFHFSVIRNQNFRRVYLKTTF